VFLLEWQLGRGEEPLIPGLFPFLGEKGDCTDNAPDEYAVS